MEAHSAAEERKSRPEARWRLWASCLIVLLVAIVSLFAARADPLVDLVGENPPAPDMFDVRRVEFFPGEIQIRVTNPQREDPTIATVTVDDAIVPFTLDGPTTLGACARHDRRPLRLGGGRADLGRRHQLHGDPDDRGDCSRGRDAQLEPGRLPRLRDHRLPRRHRADRARSPLASVACAGHDPNGWLRSWP